MKSSHICLLCLMLVWLSACSFHGEFEEQVLWREKRTSVEALIVYRGHHGGDDGQVLVRWFDRYGKQMGEVRLIRMHEFPGNTWFKEAAIDEAGQTVSVRFASEQGAVQLEIPLVLAGTDVSDLIARNHGSWMESAIAK